jgi:hypothetical protein
MDRRIHRRLEASSEGGNFTTQVLAKGEMDRSRVFLFNSHNVELGISCVVCTDRFAFQPPPVGCVYSHHLEIWTTFSSTCPDAFSSFLLDGQRSRW